MELSDFVKEKLPPVRRPNGKLYRPRVITSEFWVDDEEIESGVVVFGTHDFAVARYEAFRLLENWEGGGWVAADPERRWLKKVIRNHMYTFDNYPETGRACVLFQSLVETGIAPEFPREADPALFGQFQNRYTGKVDVLTGAEAQLITGNTYPDAPVNSASGPYSYLPSIAVP